MQYSYEDGMFLSYSEMTDASIAALASDGDNDALDYLLIKYKKFAKYKARSYFIAGADNEDIVQEGMIGLYKAIRDYKPDRLTSFYSFANLCITRQIITAIKSSTRQKHIPLNSYVSLFKPIEKESEKTLMDIITKSSELSPENIVINKEDKTEIEQKIGEILSDLESEILTSYLEDKTYQQIAKELDCHIKTIDNALQRVKRKIDRYLATRKSI